MTKFASARDPGYVAVSDQLWFWVEALQGEREAQVQAQAQAQAFQESQPQQEPAGFQNPRPQYLIDYGGGPIFQGSQAAGRDINLNAVTHRYQLE